MRRARLLLSCAVCLAACGGSAGTMSLSAERTEVVIAPRCSGVVRFAAEEMTNFLSRVFGKPIPIERFPSGEKISIILGDNEWSQEAKLSTKKLKHDGFIIKTVGKDRIHILGVDDSAGNFMTGPTWSGTTKVPQSTLYGTYEFLERYVGCRFYFPGELGEIVPQTKRLTLPEIDFRRAPTYKIRSCYQGGKGQVWFDKRVGGIRLNDCRLRMESMNVPCCHGTRALDYLNRFKESNPEYFAMRPDGGRHNYYDGSEHSLAGHLCWSSDIVDEIYKDAKSYFSGEAPSVRGIRGQKDSMNYVWGHNAVAGKFFDIMPNDGYPGCNCPKCLAAKRTDDSNYASDIIWKATATVARRLLKDGFKGYVTQMAYPPYGSIPNVDLPKNILVMVAKTGPFSKYDEKSRAQQKDGIVAWTEKLGHKVWLWNYPDKWGALEFDGVPQMCPHAWGEYYKEMQPYIIGAFAESESDRWFYNHLNFYVFSKVCWDAETDVEAVLTDYYTNMYGPAAEDVRKLFEEMEDTWLRRVTARCVETEIGPQCMPPSAHELWTKIYTPQLIDAWQTILKTAVGKVPRGSLEFKRLGLLYKEMLKPLRAESKAYLEGIDVAREMKRRADNPREISIITNGQFTEAPKGRFFGGWYSDEPPAPIDKKVPVIGGKSVLVEGSERGECITQFLPTLQPDTHYRLSFFLKLKDLSCTHRGGGAGVTLMDRYNNSFPDRTSYTGTMDWTHFSFEFTTDPETNHGVKSYIRLRTSAGTSGKAWFAGVRLTPLPKSEEEQYESSKGSKGAKDKK